MCVGRRNLDVYFFLVCLRGLRWASKVVMAGLRLAMLSLSACRIIVTNRVAPRATLLARAAPWGGSCSSRFCSSSEESSDVNNSPRFCSSSEESGDINAESVNVNNSPRFCSSSEESGDINAESGDVDKFCSSSEGSGDVNEESGDVDEESSDVNKESSDINEESSDVNEESSDVSEESSDVSEESSDVSEESSDVSEESSDVSEESGGVDEGSGDVHEDSSVVHEESGDVYEDSGDVREESGFVNDEGGNVSKESGGVTNISTKFTYQSRDTRIVLDKEAMADSSIDTRFYREIVLELYGHDRAVLTSYIKYVRYAAALLSLHCSPPVSYRRSIDKYVVNKSPFKHGSYKAQYEIRVNQKALYLWNVTGTTADVFLEYIQRNLAAGLGMNVQLQAMEPLPKSIISHMERDPGLDTPELMQLATTKEGSGTRRTGARRLRGKVLPAMRRPNIGYKLNPFHFGHIRERGKFYK